MVRSVNLLFNITLWLYKVIIPWQYWPVITPSSTSYEKIKAWVIVKASHWKRKRKMTLKLNFIWHIQEVLIVTWHATWLDKFGQLVMVRIGLSLCRLSFEVPRVWNDRPIRSLQNFYEGRGLFFRPEFHSKRRKLNTLDFHCFSSAWFNSTYKHPPPPRATTGTSPVLRSRGWGIAWSGLVTGGRGRAIRK